MGEIIHGPLMYWIGAVSFVAVCLTFALISWLGKKYKQNIPLAVNLFGCMIVGGLVAILLYPSADGFCTELGVLFRNLFEGQVWYIFINLVILTGMIFLYTMREAGNLDCIAYDMVTTFRNQPVILLFLIMLLLFFPGMVTGIGTAAVLSTGMVAVTILRIVGIPNIKIAAMVAVLTSIGAAAPPVNLPAIIIASGINMPYEGFTIILLVLTVPTGLFAAFWLGLKDYKKPSLEDIERMLPRPERKNAFMPYVPLTVVVVLFLLIRLFPGKFPDLITPLVFMIGALTTMFTGRKFHFVQASRQAISGGIFSTVALIFVVGAVVQVTTATGSKGLLVLGALTLGTISTWLMYLAISVSMPLLGGVLTHLGASVVLGIPFTLAMLQYNRVVTVAAISLIAVLAQLMPPSALGGSFAQQLTGEPLYGPVLKKCLLPMLVCIAVAIIILHFHISAAKWFVPF